MRITEDAVWRYYNCPAPHWSAKCRSCRENVTQLRVPVKECVDCWKVEIWRHGAAFAGRSEVDFDRTMGEIEAIVITKREAPMSLPVNSPVAKASRAPIQVVRTGVPETGYPALVTDSVLVLYAESIAERESLRYLVRTALNLSEAQAQLIPVRRGCWRFDPILGPWQGWYPPSEDWQSK